jgi:uncharacterized protein YgiB involved in biofilm formation
MKRSKSIKLLTMASATLALTACQEEVDTEGELYRSVLECENADLVPNEDCEPLLEEGRRIHANTAPRYNSASLCDQEHGPGECKYQSGSDPSYYAPSPYGYLVVGALAGGAVGDLVRPIYRTKDRRGYYSTGGGYVSYLGNGRYGTNQKSIRQYNPRVTQVTPKIQTRTTVASRGGFGSRSGFSFGG